MSSRQFAILGIGRFGGSVGRALSEMGYEVMGVDTDEHKVDELSSVLTHVVTADATDESVLMSLGVRNFDVVVVAVGDLEASILITVMLKEMGVKQVIVKALSDVHGRVLTKVGADRVVFPEREMGVRVAQNLVSANVVDFLELSPNFSIAEIVASHSLAGKTLRQLDLRRRSGVNVVAIKRGAHINVSPTAEDQIMMDDVLVVIGETSSIRNLERA